MEEGQAFERQVLEVGGRWTTEIISLPDRPGGPEGSSGRDGLDVVIFPGNPGSSLFYVQFMHLIRDRVGGRVRAVSHLGHARSVYKPKTYTIEEQVEHKAKFLEEHCDREKPLLLIGHSIGGYMAVKAVKAVFELSGGSMSASRWKVLAMMPYLQFDDASVKQRMLNRVVQVPYVVAGMAQLVGMVPGCARMIRWFDGSLEGNSSAVVADQLMSYTFAYNAFTLARSEFVSLRAEIDWSWLRRNASELGFIFCLGDHWSPQHLRKDVETKVPGAFVYYTEQVAHQFCTRRESCEQMADVAAEFLRGDGKGSGGQ